MNDIMNDFFTVKPVKFKTSSKRGMSSDTYLKYCTKCKMVWESALRCVGASQHSRKHRRILKYENFPTYGKTRKTCTDCK